MKIKMFRSSIIVLFQSVLLIAIAFLLSPLLLNSQKLTHLQNYFIAYQFQFMIWHALLYLALFLVWPTLVKKVYLKQGIPEEQMKKVLKFRWYLITTFILIDILMLWR